MKKLKISVILLALLLMGLTLVSAVSAAKSIEGRVIGFNATQAQVDKINQLWGKDISVGEYYAQVEPEMLVGMPDDSKRHSTKSNGSGRDFRNPDGQSDGYRDYLYSPLPTKVNGVVISFSGSATSVGSRGPVLHGIYNIPGKFCGSGNGVYRCIRFNPTTYLTNSNDVATYRLRNISFIHYCIHNHSKL